MEDNNFSSSISMFALLGSSKLPNLKLAISSDQIELEKTWNKFFLNWQIVDNMSLFLTQTKTETEEMSSLN